MLPRLFDLMPIIFMMVFSLGTLASPTAKPQDENIQPAISDLAKRGGTRWTWYNVQTGNQWVHFIGTGLLINLTGYIRVYCGGFRYNNDAVCLTII